MYIYIYVYVYICVGILLGYGRGYDHPAVVLFILVDSTEVFSKIFPFCCCSCLLIFPYSISRMTILISMYITLGF